jgi:hypothetical protein
MARILNNSIPLYPEAKHEKMREYSDGIRIGGGLELRPAPYLPIKEFDKNVNAGIVIKKGDFVTLDKYGYVVPAFVGEKTLTYGQYDIDAGVKHIDRFTNNANDPVVSAAGDSTKKLGTTATADIKIGKPLGVAMFDVYAWDMGKDPWYQVQDPITILADRMILLAVDNDHNAVNYEAGDILILDDKGFPVPFTVDNTDASTVAASLENLKYGVGRLVKVIDLVKEPDFTGALETVEYLPDDFASGLPGKPTDGVTDGIDLTTKKGLLIQLWF